MMDQGIGSALPGLNAAASAKPAAKQGSQGHAEKGSGFGDALDQVGHGEPQNGRKTASGDLPKDAAVDLAESATEAGDNAGEAPAAAPGSGRVKKPIIDIRQRVPQEHEVVHSEAGAAVLKAKAAAGKTRGGGSPEASQHPEDDVLPPDAAVRGSGTHPRKAGANAVAGSKEGGQPAESEQASTQKTETAKDAMSLLLAAADVSPKSEHATQAEREKEIGDVGRTRGASHDIFSKGAISPLLAEAAAGVSDPKSEYSSTSAAKKREVDTVGRTRSAPHDDSGRNAAASGLGSEDPSAVDGEADAKIFRLTRGGKGQSMEMIVGGRERSDAGDEPRRSTQAETVTVLDSRRYLGLAQNSSVVLDAVTGDSEWSRAMQPSSMLTNAATQASTGRVVNMLKLQLHPISLGTVTATMRLVGDELSVDLTVETAAAYRQLHNDHKGIVEALRSQGFAIDQVNVTLAATANADSSSNSNGQGGGQGASFGQQAAQDGSGGPASRRDERHAAQQQWGNASPSGEDGVGNGNSGPAGVRSGHLYL